MPIVKREKHSGQAKAKSPSRAVNRTRFNEFFAPEPEDDPFSEVDYESGDLELAASQEIEGLSEEMAEAIRKEKADFREKIDTEYFFVVCFQNREQKESFLRQMGVLAHGDKYLNGLYLAEVLGYNVPPIEVRPKRNRIKRPAKLNDHPTIKGGDEP